MANIPSNQMFRFLPWGPVLARLLLSLSIFDSRLSVHAPVADPVALAVLAWTIVSLANLLLGHLLRRQSITWQFGGDTICAAVAAIFCPQSMFPAAILVFCSAQLMIRSGFGLSYVSAVALPFFCAPLSAAAGAAPLSAIFGPVDNRVSALLILYLALLLGIMVAALSAGRGDQLRQFADHALSIRMLKLQRSLEFDLQRLVDLLASLFPDGRVSCLLEGDGERSGTRVYHSGAMLELDRNEIALLIGYRDDAGMPVKILDNDSRMLIAPASAEFVPFDEQDRRAAFLLAKNELPVALIKQFRIGRANGLVIVALPRPDAIIKFEACLISDTLDALFPILDSIAEAERNFIADAHDVARRDLHDGVLQTLAAVRMRLLSIGRRKDVKGHPAQLEVARVADILTLEQARLRGLLETSEDEDHGINLVTMLDVGLRTISMQWDIDAKLESEEPAIPIDKESAYNIEHLVREAVANAVRHANSSQLTVRLSMNQNALRVAIIDRNDLAPQAGVKKGGKSMPLRSASLLHRLRLVNGSAYADGLEQRAILAITIPMRRIDNA